MSMRRSPFVDATQQSYYQRSISSSTKACPVYRSTLIHNQSDAYARLIEPSMVSLPFNDSATAASTPDRNIFTPSIGINTISNCTIHQHFKAIATSIQQQ